MSRDVPCPKCGRQHPAGAPCPQPASSPVSQTHHADPPTQEISPETQAARVLVAETQGAVALEKPVGRAATPVPQPFESRRPTTDPPRQVGETVFRPENEAAPKKPETRPPPVVSETVYRPENDAPPPRAPSPGETMAPQASAAQRAEQPAARVEPEDLVGEMVGSFKLVRLLGKGGMGAVYLGEHPGIGSKVAIKLLHPFLASRPELVKRFYDEARAVNLIGHENIVSIFDLNQQPPNKYFIVMEYLEGTTLSQLLNEQRVSLEVATDILLQLCDALSVAHARAVVHRDLKPENIFITRRGAREHFVKLVDFGIAKLRDEHGASNATAHGVLVGTPEYMSPEQADNNPVDARSDVYSLGVIAFRLVTGRLPFEEKGIGKLIVAHLSQQPPAPRKFNPQLPPAYEAAILKALAKAPDDRHPNMQAFAGALQEAYRQGMAKPAVKTQPVPRKPTPPPVTRPEAPRVVADFDVELLQPPPQRRLVAGDVSKGGLFLRTPAGLPPLFSRVRLGLPGPGGQTVEVSAEVVRHISPSEARAWGMEPGFGVQFVELSAEARALLAALTSSKPAANQTPPPPRRAEQAHPEVQGVIDYLAERFNANHYDLLGLPADVEPKLVPAAVKVLEERIRRATEKASAEYKTPLSAGLDRVRAAQETLTTPGRRLDYDAHRGNYRGVMRLLEAGFPLAELTSRHAAFLTSRPGLETRSQQQLGRIRIARNRGNYPAALRECELALAQDPLNPELHRAYGEVLKLSKSAG